MLKPLKKSSQYAAIRKRVADPKPVDAWQANALHYFIFLLKPHTDQSGGESTPCALFLMSQKSDTPVQAQIIKPDENGAEVEVESLLQPGQVQRVRLDD